MVTLTQEAVEEYLNEAMPGAVAVTGMGAIGSLDEQGMNDFGYGKPLFVRFTQDGQPREAVISTMKGDEYGHQDWWDRARILMFQHDASSKMERHVPPLGLGYLDLDGTMHPVNRPREVFGINEKVGGHDYKMDV